MKHIRHFEHFDYPIEWLDQQIRRYTGGPFTVEIEITLHSQTLLNWPHDDVEPAAFLDTWQYPARSLKSQHYNYWEIKFNYFFDIYHSVGNQYLAKKLFARIEQLPQHYWSRSRISSGIKGNNERYRTQDGNWLDMFIEPKSLYILFDHYLTRQVDAAARKGWRGKMTIRQMKQLVAEIENEYFNPDILNFYT